MDVFIKSESYCRICLEGPGVVDWNEEILGFCGVTFKDCYFRYTQLDEKVPDVFSQMLCEMCSTEVKNTHFLIEKALETFRSLQDTLAVTEAPINTNELNDANEFKNIFAGQVTEVHDKYNTEIFLKPTKTEEFQQGKVHFKIENRDSETESDDDTGSKKEKGRLNISMCACPKQKGYMNQHVETHKEHPEREETCPKCELKYRKKREKKYKCEFCRKAFVSYETLKNHRRIHLGQTTPCTLHAKRYYQNTDLGNYMPSRSVIDYHKGVKKIKKVLCEDCNTKIPRYKWKAHRVKHGYKFTLKCKVCDKDFSERKSFTIHAKNVHQIKKNVRKIILYYEYANPGSKLPNLKLEQREKCAYF